MLMKESTKQRVVSKFPICTSFLLEGANIGQIWRMWSEKSALGQSVVSWVLVNIALWLWVTFFIVKTPKEHFAIFFQSLGILINFLVILSVVYWRTYGTN